jgi:exodeoxyribonuclease VII large subunit
MSESALYKPPQAPDRDVFTVSRLNQTARKLLEQGLARIWLEGELSNIARPSSGHLYFTLKDSKAQIRGAMFRSRNQLLRFKPQEGMQVLVRAKISLYEPRGDYQLIAEAMQEAGDGVLQQAFDALKLKLEQAGLFAPETKQPLPALPTRIGVITSPSGAAIRDVLSVLKRRFPALPVLIYPVPVQGKDAGREIAAMLETAAARNECDVLILTRGGGSLEDLWAFNEEAVARAIAASALPVVSAVGHEVDFSIADLVADHRAPTPSAAAELLSPDQREWLVQLANIEQTLQRQIRRRLATAATELEHLRRRLKHPGHLLREQAQRLDDLEQRLIFAQAAAQRQRQSQLDLLKSRLYARSPVQKLQKLQQHNEHLAYRLEEAMQRKLESAKNRFSQLAQLLDSLSPLRTLDRGYAIITDANGAVVSNADAVSEGDTVNARLARGRMELEVLRAPDHKDLPDNSA